AAITLAVFAHCCVMIGLYFLYHIYLIYTLRTTKQLFGKHFNSPQGPRYQRQRGEWGCGIHLWKRRIARIQRILIHPIRMKPLKNKPLHRDEGYKIDA